MVILIVAIASVCISQWALLSLDVPVAKQPPEPLAQSPSVVVSSQSSSSLSSLESYDPARFPVLPPSTTSAKRPQSPIRVGIVTVDPLVGEAMHFLYDGVVRSEYMSLIGIVSLYGGPNNTHPEIFLQPSDAQLWLVDGARVAKLKREFTTRLLVEAPNVVFFDWSDRFQFQLRNYHQHNVWDHANVRLAVRSIIQGRNFNGSSQIMMGRITPNLPTAGGPMLHCPYAVRSDIVETIMKQLLLGVSKDAKNPQAALEDDSNISRLEHAVLDQSPRPMDVVHMWQISFKEGKSKLRNAVSKLVRGLNGTEIVLKNDTIRLMQTSIEEQGERRKVGRNTVDSEYVQAMVQSKIVIVTQKDDWEDHYRLLEAVVCGPLVLADRMLAPPPGFVDQRTIVFFDDLTQLQDQIVYYLSHDEERRRIARDGWELAMTRHRSWHRVEEIVFGRPLTRVES
jgi:hypothetical protein